MNMEFTLKNSENFQKILSLKGHRMLTCIEMKKGNIDAITLNLNNENVITEKTVKVPLSALERKSNGNINSFGHR
jgi:hypothetical protein